MLSLRPFRGLLATAALTAALSAQAPYDELIVFGASMTDTGNAYEISGQRAARPPYYLGRFSNGPVWVEHLAMRLGLGTTSLMFPLPAPSLRGGTNYAAAGAASGDGPSLTCIFVGGVRVCTPDIGLQVEQFLQANTLDGDELIVMQGGGNERSPIRAAQNIARHVVTLIQAGGREFLVPNLYRIRPPGTTGPYTDRDHYVEEFDETLNALLDAIEILSGVKIHRLDLLALSDGILADPGSLGLTNITESACTRCGSPDASVVGNPDQYLFWDAIHFTRVVHAYYGNRAADVVLGM